MAKISEKRPSEAGAKVFAAIILTLFIPALLTLGTANVPQSAVPLTDHLTPLGYTRSLTLFAIPSAVLGWWFLRRPLYGLQRRAFWRTLALLVPLGFLLDLLLAAVFFTFPNRAATLGIQVPVVGGAVPLEEFFFYLLGFVTILLFYIWCNDYWLGAYRVPDYKAEAHDLGRVVKFHFPSLLIGVALLAAALVYKRWFSPTTGAVPWYFIFLLSNAVIPSMFLYSTAGAFVNWRALSFTFVVMLLVSLLWEATLAVPYQWWGYQENQMLGLSINAWCQLPIEAPMVWVVVTYTTVMVYEAMKIVVALERPWWAALFGKPG